LLVVETMNLSIPARQRGRSISPESQSILAPYEDWINQFTHPSKEGYNPDNCQTIWRNRLRHFHPLLVVKNSMGGEMSFRPLVRPHHSFTSL
jgi:hypothetical protein